jgi:DNA-binding transcriptional MerR regulator
VTDYCTTGDLARRLGVPVWTVRRAADRELSDPPRRAAGYRLLEPAEAARVEQALRDAGRIDVPNDR